MSKILYINENEVQKLLNWEDTFNATKTALENVAKNKVVQDARGQTRWSKNSVFLTMPAYLQDEKFGALSCKLLTVCPGNAHLEKPLPTINAHITLFDEQTGLLQAIIDGTEITKWRTAAASAVATKYLTKNKKVEILAILGAGIQGHIHALAFLHFFNFKEVRIWNRTIETAKKLALELSRKYPEKLCSAFVSNSECVSTADVIVTATFASEPIVQLEWLKTGVHINAVGVNAGREELSPEIYTNSRVYIDHLKGAQDELPALKSLEFRGEIGAVITGELPAPAKDEISVFRSLGMAAEDGAMARMIYDSYKNKSK